MSDERFYIDEHVLTLESGRAIPAWAMFDRDERRIARFVDYAGAVAILRDVRSGDFDPELLTWRNADMSDVFPAVLVPDKED